MELEQQTQGTEDIGLTDQASVQEEGDSTGGGLPQDEQAFDVNGEQVKLSDLRSGYLRQSDYTRKTQELASQRDQLKQYVELESYLKTNPEIAKKVYDVVNGEQNDPVQRELMQLKNVTNNLLLENANAKVQNTLSAIKNEAKYEGLYNDPDMESILLATALQSKKTRDEDIKEIADKIHSKILKVRVDSEKAGEKKVVENLKQSTRKGEAGRGSYTPPKDFDASKSDWKSVKQRALEMLN